MVRGSALSASLNESPELIAQESLSMRRHRRFACCLNESPELIAQESADARPDRRKQSGLNESPELIAQELVRQEPASPLFVASMKVLSLLLRNPLNVKAKRPVLLPQ